MRRWLAPFVLAFALVPVLTACADGDDDDPVVLEDVRAWEVGDAPTAEVFATDEAFDALFALEGGGVAGAFQLVGCDGAAGSSFCTFNAGGDPTLILRVNNELAGQAAPDAVTEVRFEG